MFPVVRSPCVIELSCSVAIISASCVAICCVFFSFSWFLMSFSMYSISIVAFFSE